MHILCYNVTTTTKSDCFRSKYRLLDGEYKKKLRNPQRCACVKVECDGKTLISIPYHCVRWSWSLPYISHTKQHSTIIILYYVSETRYIFTMMTIVKLYSPDNLFLSTVCNNFQTLKFVIS